MLSIGKLAPAQAKYYLDQAEGRVDVVDSVADGIEEYYVGRGEARGEWIGEACRELGLAGGVDGPALRAVLAGSDPRDGGELRRQSGRSRVGGYDLTFSAPKSVSVLFGVAGGEVRSEVRAAHDVAAREAIGFVERSAAAVRRGHGGLVVEQVEGFVAAAFRHRTSRAGDPQLHTHVLVANLGRGSDGRWSALDGRQLYAHARTASFVYQAVLRGELSRRLGVEWTPVHRGIAEVVGVRGSVLRAFSRRRAEIEASLEGRGTTGARAAEAAVLATRSPKDARVRAEELTDEWRARAAAFGVGDRELEVILGRSRVHEPLPGEWERASRDLASPIGLTHRAPTFSRVDVIRGLCEALPAGAQVDAATLEGAADRFLSSEHAIALVDAGATDEVFRRRDGRTMPAAVHRLRYSTPAQLSLEQHAVDRVLAARGAGAARARRGDVDAAIAARPVLSSEQRRAIEVLCLAGDGVAVVAGKAGTGKTFTLGAAREAWQAAGYAVLGVATARRAARELQDGAGIASTSTAALTRRLSSGAANALPERCVLVVDEAGMVATRDIAKLLDHVERAGGKLVLVGDDRQLPELGAGGTFHGLVKRGLAIELTENLRQSSAWEREALDHLREGDASPALALYAAHDRVHVGPSEESVRARLVDDWHAAGDPDNAVMLAHRRADVADLNECARARLLRDGLIRGPALSLPGGEFAVGDRIVLKRNDSRLEVDNGDRARVVAVDSRSSSLVVRRGETEIVLDRRYLAGPRHDGEPALAHGYAITGHVAQGLTVDKAFVLVDDSATREWAYVAMSRGRTSNRLYVAETPENLRAEFAPTSPPAGRALERLADRMRISQAQILAIDTGKPPVDGLAAARHQLSDIERERRQLEAASRWRPGTRARLEDAKARESTARAQLNQARRLDAEYRHAAEPFVEPRDEHVRLKELLRKTAERAHERALGRDRSRGREL